MVASWLVARLPGGEVTGYLSRLSFTVFSIVFTGAPNDNFLSDPLKRNFRLSGVLLKLCRFNSSRAIILLSVWSF